MADPAGSAAAESHRVSSGADPGMSTASKDPDALRVLVVEDNPDGREALQELLEMWDYDVLIACDGIEALDVVDSNPPDVALVDIGLPQLDGYELARRLRDRPGGEHIYLIAMTGYGQPEDRRRAFDAGFDLHLVKPVPPKRLSEILEDLSES